MLQDARTNKVDKATTVVIDIMPTTRRTTVATSAPTSAVVPEVEDATILDSNVDVPEADVPEAEIPEVNADTDADSKDAVSTNFFDQFTSDEADVEKSRDDIVSELVKKPNVKKLTGLHIKNVVTNPGKDVPFLTFVVKEWVIGDTRSGAADAFGIQQVVLGKTHNVIVGAYAVSAVMKDNPRTAIFAARIGGDEDIANMLFAGGTMDILMEYVAAGETYTNPFSRNGATTTFDRDHVIFHILSLTMGEAGRDAYAARIARI